MTLEELRFELEERDFPESTYFVNPDYANAILGITTEGRVAYSFKKMVEHLTDEETTEEQAADLVRYNAVAMLEQMGEFHPTIILDY